jgi:MFS family permease
MPLIFYASLAVSLSVLATAVGSLTWASYSGFCKSCQFPSKCFRMFQARILIFVLDGRRPVLLLSMLTLAIASIGSGSSTTVLSLLVWRVIQAFGSASGMSVGIAVLADIYKMEERGTASGAFFGVSTYKSLS